MNITDSKGIWEVTSGRVRNRKTNESVTVSGIPTANAIAYMSEDKFIKCCEIAHSTGSWPK